MLNTDDAKNQTSTAAAVNLTVFMQHRKDYAELINQIKTTLQQKSMQIE